MSKKRKLDHALETVFACAICLDTLCMPLLCNSCGQCMCEMCLLEWLNGQEAPKCPLCNVVNMTFTPCRVLADFLRDEELRCPFESKGCKFSTPDTSVYRTHLRACTFRRSQCSAKNCEWQGDCVELLRHEKECVWIQLPDMLAAVREQHDAAMHKLKLAVQELEKKQARLVSRTSNAAEGLQLLTKQLNNTLDLLTENCSAVYLTPRQSTTQSFALFYNNKSIMLPLFINITETESKCKCRVYLGTASKSKLNFPCLALGYFIAYNRVRGSSYGNISQQFAGRKEVKPLFALNLQPPFEQHLKFNLLLRLY